MDYVQFDAVLESKSVVFVPVCYAALYEAIDIIWALPVVSGTFLV